MSDQVFQTLVVGVGKIAAGYSADPLTAKHYQYATHAQVLKGHPGFEWSAAVDVAEDALRIARDCWGVQHTARTISGLPGSYRPDVAVIATPPEGRIDIIESLPDLKAVIVEKPLGRNIAEAESFLAACKKRSILVQVNLWRRADRLYGSLRKGKLAELIGNPQAVFGVYGNGLLNNGVHMIDFIRMLAGEVESVQAAEAKGFRHSAPIPGDTNPAVTLMLAHDITASLQPISFRTYRENSIDVWGESGRLSLLNEGLINTWYPVKPHRALQGEKEVSMDEGSFLGSTVGDALFRLYDNLADALINNTPLCSPLENAFKNEKIAACILKSAQCGGAHVAVA